MCELSHCGHECGRSRFQLICSTQISWQLTMPVCMVDNIFVDQDNVDRWQLAALLRLRKKEMECCCWLIVDTKNTMSGGCKCCASIKIDEGGRYLRSSFCSKSARVYVVECVKRPDKIKKGDSSYDDIFNARCAEYCCQSVSTNALSV